MTKLFDKSNRHLLIAIITLAWPTMLEQLMQTAVQYIDTAMVGALGTQATAAVGATSTVNWLVSSTISALGVGFLAYIARSLGAGDEKGARKASSQATLAVLVAGIFFTVLTLSLSKMVPVWMQVDESIQAMAATYFFIMYMPMLPRTASIILGTVLRAAGDTKTPMKVGVMMNIINIVLNFLLIYETRVMNIFGLEFTMPGAGMGVIGAAVGSAVSFTIGGLYIFIVFWNHKHISPKGLSLKPDMHIIKPCMKIAFPNMLQRFGTSLGYVAFASMINSLGDISTAAHTIANTVESLFYIPGYGMQTAAATLAGNAYGAGDRDRMNNIAGIMIPIVLILMAISGGLLFIFAPPLMGIFSKSDEVIRLGATVLRMVAVSEPFFGYSTIVEGLLQGVGKTKEPFVFNIVGMWLIRICCTFVCTQMLGFGLVSAWACMIAHNIFLFAMFLIMYIRGSWNPLNENKKGAF